MGEHDTIFQKIAEALLIDYSSVYYVNAVTNEYRWYSADPQFHSLKLAQNGKDFFVNLVHDAEQVIYEEDKHIFTKDIRKERLLSEMKKGTMHSLEYRLMIDGKPVWHSLRLIRGLSSGDDYFILGVLNVDKEVRQRLAAAKIRKEREIFNQIALSLAEHYDTLYYVDLETEDYFEVYSTDVYKELQVPIVGSDFFANSRKNIKAFIHPDDYERMIAILTKEQTLKTLQENSVLEMTYRLRLDGEYVYCRYSAIWASDRKHVIVGVENVNSRVLMEEALRESRRQNVTYGQIAESLAAHYDVIYYVNSVDSSYVGFTTNSIYGNLEIQEKGKEFFADVKRNVVQVVHPQDQERITAFLTDDNLISVLENRKLFSTEYRLLIEGQTQYTRMTVMWSSDHVHLIIGVENINKEVEQRRTQEQALNQANELARCDELTGTKNKNAYHELELSVQSNLDKGIDYSPFALLVCDINNLKVVNDTLGHKAGDEYIRAACKMICVVFSHSPVYRIGGDEFVVFLRGSDYENREVLLHQLRMQVLENLKTPNKPVLASGLAIYNPETDTKFSQVFERADGMMYEDKIHLKETALNDPDRAIEEMNQHLPPDRKRRLDMLFNALSIAAEGAYVFLCDMQYDYSRWSKLAVDTFGLPSEYMYAAGRIWEENVHPDDRETYHAGIGSIFAGKADGHDMQYRAMKADGEYTVCTCRGIVMNNDDGKPEYFGGIIRNHGQQWNVDPLTGLRNQYGFFEDLQYGIRRKVPMRICLIGISKFSEINEVYGYHFGNSVLQHFGRYLFEHVGNTGCAYRLDGTRFAVMSTTLSIEEIKMLYEMLRRFFREQFVIDDRSVILDLNAGLLTADHFDIDDQTVYACLNFAYNMSKVRMQGDLVEFYNNLTDENKHRLEKLHAIRASIMQQFKGFFLLYQPVVDAHTEKLIGAESLLRWKSEEYGMVPPDHFIPILEKDPFFCDLGEWILRTAVDATMRILPSNPDFVMNVNIAYTQLERNDFTDMVLRVLEETGCPPQHLCLEITERCRLLDMDRLKNVIVNLRAHGVLIALDDFGTGFSSLGVVKNLPFDIIKIDRSFVRKIEEDNKERELIKAFLDVAATFGAKVCVEGIETAGMRDILQRYNVRSFQGYYYSKPIPLDAFLEWSSRRIEPSEKQ